jgi:hypothetical protein
MKKELKIENQNLQSQTSKFLVCENQKVGLLGGKIQSSSLLSDERGITTTDFLFSMMFAISMIMVTLALTFTLSMMEITQYITYSAARAMSAAQETSDLQIEKAKSKFNYLSQSHPAFKNLYAGSWFSLSVPEIRSGTSGGGGSKNFETDYPSSGLSSEFKYMHGVRATLTAKVLEINVPFIGSLAPENGGFSARLVSIMLRESSFQECRDWMSARFQKLFNEQTLKNGSAPPVAWEDNGC